MLCLINIDVKHLLLLHMQRTFFSNSNWHIRVSVCLALILFAGSLHAGQYYRYKDESGTTVLNRTIPPALVGNGYDILSEKGRLIKSVPPALTPEQITARDAEIARKERLAAEQARQKKLDDELRQLYSHPNDAARSLKRKVQDIHAVIQVKHSKIKTAQQEIVNKESKAANMQRNGINIPDSLIKQIKSLKKDIVNSKAEIAEMNSEKKKVLNEFDQKIRRLEKITGKQADEYQTFLQDLNSGKNTQAKAEKTAAK